MSALEKTEQESAKKILELLDVKSELTSRQRDLEQENAQAEVLRRDQQTLQTKVNELQVRQESLLIQNGFFSVGFLCICCFCFC